MNVWCFWKLKSINHLKWFFSQKKLSEFIYRRVLSRTRELIVFSFFSSSKFTVTQHHVVCYTKWIIPKLPTIVHQLMMIRRKFLFLYVPFIKLWLYVKFISLMDCPIWIKWQCEFKKSNYSLSVLKHGKTLVLKVLDLVLLYGNKKWCWAKRRGEDKECIKFLAYFSTYKLNFSFFIYEIIRKLRNTKMRVLGPPPPLFTLISHSHTKSHDTILASYSKKLLFWAQT